MEKNTFFATLPGSLLPHFWGHFGGLGVHFRLPGLAEGAFWLLLTESVFRAALALNPSRGGTPWD